MITIKDVAKRAGVSITSASYALNGNGTIGEETRKRVLRAAEELNYHPNAFARNLKSRKSHTIGVFINSFGGSFYEDILEGIYKAVLKTEYEMIVSPNTRTVRKILTHRQVDGAIVFDSKVNSETLLRLASAMFPIIVLDRYLDAEYLFPLLVDNMQGTRDAFHHLYRQGARKMAFLSGASDSFDNMERRKAFFTEADKHDVTVQDYSGNFTENSGYECGKEIIGSGCLPDAVFCANDQMAIGLMRAMAEHNLKAPDDIAVVGFDDIQIAQYLTPSLSSVGSSRFAWGQQAAVQLIDFLENGNIVKPDRIPTTLYERESSLRVR